MQMQSRCEWVPGEAGCKKTGVEELGRQVGSSLCAPPPPAPQEMWPLAAPTFRWAELFFFSTCDSSPSDRHWLFSLLRLLWLCLLGRRDKRRTRRQADAGSERKYGRRGGSIRWVRKSEKWDGAIEYYGRPHWPHWPKHAFGICTPGKLGGRLRKPDRWEQEGSESLMPSESSQNWQHNTEPETLSISL